jgi:hypothetical protein
MNVVSCLHCLEQANDDGAVAAFIEPLGQLRDALYELYCESGDPRMRPLHAAGGLLSAYVAGLYALCDDILETLTTASGLGGDDPDVVRLATRIRASGAAFEQASAELPDRISEALASVAVDVTNAVDPLRGVGERFQDLVRAARELARTRLV